MAKKKESSLNLIIKIVVLVGVMVAVVGIIANVVGDVNDTIDGFGGGPSSTKNTTSTTETTISPSDCENHEYNSSGICSKCGATCGHADKETATNGNTYCAECGKLYALKAPSITVSAALISWNAVPDAESYVVNVNDATYKTENTSYRFSSDEAGEFIVTVQAVSGSVTSEKSNSYTFTYYSVSYNSEDHGNIIADSLVVKAGATYVGMIVPADGYLLPSEIYITMGGADLTSGYVYDNTTGDFTIYNVTGDLYITYDATTGVPGVPVLTLNGSVVSWEAVPGATDYHVRVLGKNTTDLFDKYYEITATSFDLSYVGFTESATYTVSVWADNEYGFGEAAAIEYVYSEAPSDLLTAPEISFSSEGVIVWEAVPGADFYTIYVKGSEAEGSMRITSECRFDLTTYADELTEFGNVPYTIYIKVSGEGYADSAASNKLTYNPSGEMLKLATPVIELV